MALKNKQLEKLFEELKKSITGNPCEDCEEDCCEISCEHCDGGCCEDMEAEEEDTMAKKKKLKMGLDRIELIVVNNGFILRPKDTGYANKTYVFKTLEQLNAWLKKNMSPVGDKVDFINEL